MTGLNHNVNEDESNNSTGVLSNRAIAILEKHGLSDYFSEDYDISSLSISLQGLIIQFRSNDREPDENNSEKEIIAKLKAIALTMISQIRNENSRQEVARALEGMDLDLTNFSHFEQLQLIKFFNIAVGDERTRLLGVIDSAEGDFNAIQKYITKIKSQHVLENVNKYAVKFENDSPIIETKKKRKKNAQDEAEQEDSDIKDKTRKDRNYEAAQIIADHDKKEREFAKKDEQFQKRRDAMDTLQNEVNEIEGVIETIEELRNSLLMKIIELKKYKSIKTINKKVSELEENNAFSKPLKIFQLDKDFKVIIDNIVHSIDDYVDRVSNGEILVNDLDISENNLHSLEKELQKKQRSLKMKQGNFEKSTTDLESKKQAYHDKSNEKVKNAKQQLEVFEARKRKLKELSEGSREGIIGYAQDIVRKGKLNYQAKILPEKVKKLNEELVLLKKEQEELVLQLEHIEKLKLGFIELMEDEDVAKPYIDQLLEKEDFDGISERLATVKKTISDKEGQLVKISTDKNGQGILIMNDEHDKSSIIIRDVDTSELTMLNETPATYTYLNVAYIKVEGKKHTYKNPDPSKELYIIVPTDDSPIRFLNNEIVSIDSIEYGRAIGTTVNDTIARACNQTGEYAKIKIPKIESYTTNIPTNKNLVISNNTLQCFIEKNGIKILASLPLTKDNSGEITLRYESAELTTTQDELQNKLNEITSENNQAAVTNPVVILPPNPVVASVPSSPGPDDGGPITPPQLPPERTRTDFGVEGSNNTVIVSKEEAQILFLTLVKEHIESRITDCVIEYYNNGFLITFHSEEGEEIWCNMEDSGTTINLNSFMCSSNDERFNRDYLNKFLELNILIRTHYNNSNSLRKIKSIEIAKESQPSETLRLTYENDDKGGDDDKVATNFPEYPLEITNLPSNGADHFNEDLGDDDPIITFLNRGRDESDNNPENLTDVPLIVKGKRFIYTNKDGKYVTTRNGGKTFEGEYEDYVENAASDNEILINESDDGLDFYCPNLDIKVNEQYDKSIAILEFTENNYDLITKNAKGENVQHNGVYLQDTDQNFIIIVKKGTNGNTYKLLMKDKDNTFRFKRTFRKLDACVKFEKSGEDEISGYRYNMDTSTEDEDGNDINIFTIHNLKGETREIALTDTKEHTIYIADEDNREDFSSVDAGISKNPHICVMAGEIPLVLSFDGNIYGKNKDGNWIIVNENQGDSGQDDNVDLQTYLEGLEQEKELSDDDLRETMIDLINNSEFMTSIDGKYIPEVSFEGRGERITMSVILKPNKKNLLNRFLKPIKFSSIIRNHKDGIFIDNPTEVEVGLSVSEFSITNGFTNMNAQFKGKLKTDEKEVKSLKVKNGRLMVTYQTKKP